MDSAHSPMQPTQVVPILSRSHHHFLMRRRRHRSRALENLGIFRAHKMVSLRPLLAVGLSLVIRLPLTRKIPVKQNLLVRRKINGCRRNITDWIDCCRSYHIFICLVYSGIFDTKDNVVGHCLCFRCKCATVYMEDFNQP